MRHDRDRLRDIRYRLNRRFYTADQYSRIIRKAALNDFVRFLPGVFAALPSVLFAIARHEILKPRKN